jgi:C1A family cysteine protease
MEISGYLPDPHDSKDISFSSVKTEDQIEESVDLEPFCSPIDTQLRLNSCVANATADSIELINSVQGLSHSQVSRLQIYYNGRSIMYAMNDDHTSLKDEGMWIRAAFRAIANLGVCSEDEWPYDPKHVNTRPPVGLMFKSLKNKISGYYKITNYKVAEFKRAISAMHPVVMGIPVNDGFKNYKGGILSPPEVGDKIYGHHAIMAMGFGPDFIKIRNSWGPGFGEDGYAKLDPAWIEIFARDCWVPTRGEIIK